MAATNHSTNAAPDIITDFLEGTDRIDLSAIDASSLFLGNQAFAFVGSGPFLLPGQLRYFTDGAGDTIIQGNVDANPATAEFSIKLLGSHTLTAADFVL
jgi:hypothetical protein